MKQATKVFTGDLCFFECSNNFCNNSIHSMPVTVLTFFAAGQNSMPVTFPQFFAVGISHCHLHNPPVITVEW